jgi:hypothetical protein
VTYFVEYVSLQNHLAFFYLALMLGMEDFLASAVAIAIFGFLAWITDLIFAAFKQQKSRSKNNESASSTPEVITSRPPRKGTPLQNERPSKLGTYCFLIIGLLIGNILFWTAGNALLAEYRKFAELAKHGTASRAVSTSTYTKKVFETRKGKTRSIDENRTDWAFDSHQITSLGRFEPGTTRSIVYLPTNSQRYVFADRSSSAIGLFLRQHGLSPYLTTILRLSATFTGAMLTMFCLWLAKSILRGN